MSPAKKRNLPAIDVRVAIRTQRGLFIAYLTTYI